MRRENKAKERERGRVEVGVLVAVTRRGGLASSAFRVLLGDPLVSLLHACLQCQVGFPIEFFLDEDVISVTLATDMIFSFFWFKVL